MTINEAGLTRSSFITHTYSDINEKYDIRQKIGEGSYGSVYYSIHKPTFEERAIKQIAKSSIRYQDRLRSEISVLAQSDFPFIIKLHEIIEDTQNYYIITEYCKGGELFEYILKRKRLPENEASILFKQIMLSIKYLHSRNLIHRDIKPENLMFSDNTHLKLIDFGVAKLMNSKPLTTRIGTPYYISPDVLKGTYTELTDIWSAGVILYLMLCGYPPFYSSSDIEIYRKILIGNYSFIGEEWRGVSDCAKDLIKNMLLVNTDLRINALQALQHPWLARETSMVRTVVVGREFALFSQINIIKHAALMSIAAICGDKGYEELEDVFIQLDNESKGTVALLDLLRYFKELGLSDLNFIENRLIEYSEFLTVFLVCREALNAQIVSEAFRSLERKLLELQSRAESTNKTLMELQAEFSQGFTLQDFTRIIFSHT